MCAEERCRQSLRSCLDRGEDCARGVYSSTQNDAHPFLPCEREKSFPIELNHHIMIFVIQEAMYPALNMHENTLELQV